MSLPGIAHVSAIEPKEAERIAAMVASRIPRSLVPVFDARFTRSNALYDEFVYRLTLRIFHDTGLDAAVAEWGNAEKIGGPRRRGPPPRNRVPLNWMLCHLARRGRPRARGHDRRTPVPRRAAHPDSGSGADRGRAAPARPRVPAVVRAGRDGRPRVPGVSPRRASPARRSCSRPRACRSGSSYFSNDNILYAVNNRVGRSPSRHGCPPSAHDPRAWRWTGERGAAVLERLAGVGRLGDSDVPVHRAGAGIPAAWASDVLQEAVPGRGRP